MTLQGNLVARVTQPLKTSVYSLIGELPGPFVKRLKETISWQNRDSWTTRRVYGNRPNIYTTGTRSLSMATSPLERDYFSQATQLPIQAIQLKGLIYIPSELTETSETRSIEIENIQVPSMDEFTVSNMNSFKITDQGNYTADNQKWYHPRGPIFLDEIDICIDLMTKAANRGLITPFPIGFGIFEELKHQGRESGFLILGVYDEWNSRFFDFFTIVQYNNPHAGPGRELMAPHPLLLQEIGASRDFYSYACAIASRALQEKFDSQLPEISAGLFRRYGQGLIDIFRKKLFMNNHHIENVLLTEQGIVHHDFESSKDITDETPVRQTGYAALGLRNVFNQLQVHISNAEALNANLLKLDLTNYNPYEEILLGCGFDPDAAKKIGGRNLFELTTWGVLDDSRFQRDIPPLLARKLFG